MHTLAELELVMGGHVYAVDSGWMCQEALVHKRLYNVDWASMPDELYHEAVKLRFTTEEYV